MQNIWNRIESWCAQYAPDVLTRLNPGATEEQLRASEEKLGVTFPEEMRQLYAIHNGQKDGGFSPLPVGDWLSLDDIFDQWDVWEELRRGGEFDGVTSEPDAGVSDAWWNASWIPITHDGGGNHYCVDLAPAEGGTIGQIITMWHDDGARNLVAASLTGWLTRIADGMESGEYVFSPEEYGEVTSRDDVSDGGEWRGVTKESNN
jgi:cell wall assembly regulator SMI1